VTVVVIAALKYRPYALVDVTADVVDAADVVIELLGTFQKLVASIEAWRATTPAETPAVVVTTRVAFGRTVPASRMAEVADAADFPTSDSTGPIPKVCASIETPLDP
jgi:hypothetical protein